MAAYFQLLDKQTGQAAILGHIDDELCDHFKQPRHDTLYLANWIDFIGFRAAMGNTWEQIIEDFNPELERNKGWDTSTLIAIAEYLKTKYDINHWTGH